MLNKLEQHTDWQSKYQAALDDLETRTRQWSEIEELLRETIGRLCLSGHGLDVRLDQQLQLIQELSREKRDTKLAAALQRLSGILSMLEEQPPPSKQRRADPIMLLLELLQGVHFDKMQRQHLREICSELLKSVAGGHDRDKISGYIRQLARLINENFDNLEDGARATKIVFRLLDLLDLDSPAKAAIESGFAPDCSMDDTQLRALAELINRQFHLVPPDTSIDQVMTTLLERLAIVQGANGSAQEIQTRVQEGVESGQWADTLNDIVNSISESLNKLNHEKCELETFIVKVTEQLGDITQDIVEDHRDHQSDHQDAQSLHDFVQEGMSLMQKNFQSSNDLQQLKQDITQNIDHIRDGVEGFVNRFNERHEATEERNLKLTEQLSQMEQETQQLQVMLMENRTKLLYDALTGVYSRMAYDERIPQELARWNRYQTPFSYVIIDIDHFKRINDSYGHNAGDKALKIIAQLMQQYVRQSDYVFRIGGEEFVLLLTNTSAQQANEMVTNLRAAIADSSVHFKGEPVTLTLSAGITETRNGDDVESIYERADAALYQAKHSGRNRQHIAD